MRIDRTTIGRRRIRWLVLLASGVVVLVGALELSAREPLSEADPTDVAPAHVEELGATGRSRVILTPSAARRLGVRTAEIAVRAVTVDGRTERRKVVPYAAVVYTADGATWVYVSRRRLAFERAPVAVADIQGDLAALSSGPAVGAAVATKGVAEIYGSEFGVDH